MYSSRYSLVVVGIGVILQHQNDLGAHIVLVSLSQGVALHTGGLPLPGRVGALWREMTVTFFATIKAVEADTELADDVDVIALVFGLEIERAALAIVPRFFSRSSLRHADAVIADGQRAAVLVRLDMDLQIVLRDADGGIGQVLK